MASAAPSVPRSPARRAVTAALAAATACVAVWVAGDVARVARSAVPIDFLAFWAAGRLNADGQNPYDPALVWQTQHAAGYTPREAVMMWNPPWVLAVVMPLGLLPADIGHLVWQLFQLAVVGFAADRLWVVFGGPRGRRWVGWLLGLTFAPTAFLVGSGQITGLCLLGVVGFLAARRAGWPALAGVTAALTAAKPHLLALFGLALVLDATRSRAGRVALFTGTLTVLAATLVASIPNPAVLGQYLDSFTAPSSADHRAPADWRHPTPGSYLRAAVAPDSFAVQLVPLAVGVIILLVAWWRLRDRWDWNRATPWLVIGSLLAAPYGAWSYDLAMLLVPVLAAAARLARGGWPARALGLAWFAAVSAALFACLMQTPKVPEETYVWVTPAVLAGVLVLSRFARPAGGVA